MIFVKIHAHYSNLPKILHIQVTESNKNKNDTNDCVSHTSQGGGGAIEGAILLASIVAKAGDPLALGSQDDLQPP